MVRTGHSIPAYRIVSFRRRNVSASSVDAGGGAVIGGTEAGVVAAGAESVGVALAFDLLRFGAAAADVVVAVGVGAAGDLESARAIGARVMIVPAPIANAPVTDNARRNRLAFDNQNRCI